MTEQTTETEVLQALAVQILELFKTISDADRQLSIDWLERLAYNLRILYPAHSNASQSHADLQQYIDQAYEQVKHK